MGITGAQDLLPFAPVYEKDEEKLVSYDISLMQGTDCKDS